MKIKTTSSNSKNTIEGWIKYYIEKNRNCKVREMDNEYKEEFCLILVRIKDEYGKEWEWEVLIELDEEECYIIKVFNEIGELEFMEFIDFEFIIEEEWN